MGELIITVVLGIIALLVIGTGLAAAASRFYRKVGPEEALVRAGGGELKVATGRGMWVVPLVHRVEPMDLTLKRIEIARKGTSGLICKDNIRADIEVAFFVRVSNDPAKIKEVAQSIGCARASEQVTLVELFDAKFSEALKTVGKQFDFVQLYDQREQFKSEIIKVIGTDLNGYQLDDAAIDYLEQTPLDLLSPNNILDAEGIKKITELTAQEKVQENQFTREKEKTLKKQDVEAAEAILELEKQRVEAVQKQEREIAEITAREQAEAAKVQEEQRLRAETARISTEEELGVAEENKLRQIIVAAKSKEKTDAVETERVTRDKELEATERLRVVGVADVEKEKAIEVEKRNIQEVIRERVMVERAVVEEQEKIKDTEQFAGADRTKQVAITAAEQKAEENLVVEVKAAEAKKRSAELIAEQVVIEASAQRDSAEREMQATKMLAEAKTADSAAVGLGEAQVEEAKADALQKTGTAEAEVSLLKYSSEAKGIKEKAAAMKLFDDVGKDHEEFKLRLNKDKEIEIAAIDAQSGIAEAQSKLVGEALKSARIDIVGGDGQFFDQIVHSVKGGKAIDRFVNNSEVASDVKNTFFNGNPEYFRDKVQQLVTEFNLSTDDVKDLSIAALIAKMIGMANSDQSRSQLTWLDQMAASLGMSDERVDTLKLGSAGVGDGSTET
ncbi:MAG: flotillin family protein [Planctomycetota bacterium]